MGLLGKVTSRLRRTESDTAGPSTTHGVGERIPRYYETIGEATGRAEEEIDVDDELPSYTQLFHTDRVTPSERQVGKPPKVPRRPLSDSVLNILSSYLSRHSPALLTCLALLDKAAHATVIPHLYHTIPIERNTIHQVLYGIPIPVQGFVFDPTYDGKGKRKEGDYRPDAVLSAESEERKRRCLGYTKRIVIESVIPDWTTCRSLSTLRNPDRLFVDTSDDAPGTQYHPMRQPVLDSEKAAIASRTSLLMPNVEVMVIRPQAIQALARWEVVDGAPHILPEALANLCQPTTLDIDGSVMDLVVADHGAGASERYQAKTLIATTIERFGNASETSRRTVRKLIWRGVTNDPIPCVPGCEVVIQFAASPPSIDIDPEQATAARIYQILDPLERLDPIYPTRLELIGPGLVHPDLDEAIVHDNIVRAIYESPRHAISADRLANLKFYSLDEAVQKGFIKVPTTPPELAIDTCDSPTLQAAGTLGSERNTPSRSDDSVEETRKKLFALASRDLEDPAARTGILLNRASDSQSRRYR